MVYIIPKANQKKKMQDYYRNAIKGHSNRQTFTHAKEKRNSYAHNTNACTILIPL